MSKKHRRSASVVIVDLVRLPWDCTKGMHRPFWSGVDFDCLYCGMALDVKKRGSSSVVVGEESEKNA